MNSEKGLANAGAAAVECRKAASCVVCECCIVIIVCGVFVGLAWQLLARLPVLRMICLIAFVGCAGCLITTLVKNPPWIVLANNMLRARCYPLGKYGEMGRAKELAAPVEGLDRVWVGRPRDYPSDLLINDLDTNLYPWLTTMVIWLRSEGTPYLVREFSSLSETDKLLDHLKTLGIQVETPPPVPARTV